MVMVVAMTLTLVFRYAVCWLGHNVIRFNLSPEIHQT